ncbi:MAG TPA: 2-hydroxychromene-2-carboxylate isomerase [Xanthobacteraceae bacterium]|jgi:2-hydroxychromene-2-carboxylate isomerase|nr:2-hydroxychromene-2-carboxylate isomerase [Xanthobacteraceae bacterium]
MSRTIDYYFTLASPWAFLGHKPFLDLAKQTGVTVHYKPVDLGEVFPHTGGLPLPKRHPARQKYRILELQRWREARGVPLKINPKHWPFPATTANRTISAVAQSGGDPGPYTQRAFEGVWVRDEDLSQDATLVALLDECGHDGARMLASAKSDAIGKIYADTATQAVERNVIGSPCYVLDGEVFWGQDRLDLLASALESGRAAYRMDATA